MGRVKYFDMNYGQTPALDVSMYIKVVPGEAPATLDEELTEEERQGSFKLFIPNKMWDASSKLTRLRGRPISSFCTATSTTPTFLVIAGDIASRSSMIQLRKQAGGEAFSAHSSYNDEKYLGRDKTVA